MRVFLVILCLAGPVCADATGPVKVIDGDTFDIGGERVRMFGVDAPEIGQPCQSAIGESIDCGSWVAEHITTLFEGKTAHCIGRERDRYDRLVATCTVDGQDMGRSIVAAGLAKAYLYYSQDYAADEKGAAIHGRGIWQFTFADPASYRREQPSPQETAVTCTIKGNITANGRIYHMPHNRDYGRTRISQAKGERWFCSQEDALNAGWRAALN